jgi:hypothetical protein
MAWMKRKAFWLFLPASADVVIRGESFERFEALCEVIGHKEGLQMCFQAVMGLVVIRFHRGVFARAVHACHLAMRPGMVGFGEPMVDARLLTDAIKDLLTGVDIALAVGEWDAVIGQHGMNLLGHGGDQVPEDLSRNHVVGWFMQLSSGHFAGPVNGDKSGERAFFRCPIGPPVMVNP